MMKPNYVRVIIDRAIQRELDYSVPETLAERIGIGSRVRVPFRDRSALATVLATLDQSDAKGIRPIEALVGEAPVISEPLLELAKWMGAYYCCPLETVMRSLLPQVMRGAEVGWKKQLFVQPLTKIDGEKLDNLRKRAPRQAELLEAIAKLEKPMPAAQLLRKTSFDNQTLRALAKRGLIELREEAVERDPHADEQFIATTNLELNAEQILALNKVTDALAAPETAKPILLHGVTGSGKTEIYLQAIRIALERGKSAIVLVPEISLTPQTVERFKSRFFAAHDSVAVLHSHLSEGERHDEWHKVHSGRAHIVIGARSAVFAPLQNLGLIVVDEEHETSYKQEEVPRYSARDTAVMRGKLAEAAVVLGSATPSMESFRNAESKKYEYVALTTRVEDRPLPGVEIVNMRDEYAAEGRQVVFSRRLLQAVAERLERREQTMILLNRRGYAAFLLCRHCGFNFQCNSCSVAMPYHRAIDKLLCHYCGFARRPPKRCSECDSEYIHYVGEGTERLEAELKTLFPDARVGRIDRDTMRHLRDYERVLGGFASGDLDVLVGTQMIAKGHDFPRVTLVGVIGADTALSLPDFRAAER